MKFSSFRWRSLKTRVTLFTLAIFLFSLWSLAFFASRTLHHDMQNLLSNQQFSIISFIAEEINQELGDRLRLLETTAEKLGPVMLDNPATLQAVLEERLSLSFFFNGAVFITGMDGVVVARIPLLAGMMGVNYLDRDYITGALQEGKTTIGRPVIGKVLRTPFFGMAAPIRDPQGGVIGAVAGITNLDQPNFLGHLTNSRYGQSGGYLLIAPQHRLVVTASDKSRIMETLPAPGINPLLDRFLEGYEGSAVIRNPQGVEVLASDKGIPVAGWIASATLPTFEAFAPIHAMQQRMIIATVFLTLLAGGLTWWMLRRQLFPMLTAVRSLAAWSKTDQPPPPLPVNAQGEIGKLIGSFNRLLNTVAQREQALKQSNAFKNIILNSVDAEIAVVDRDGVIVAVNDRWRQFALDNSLDAGLPVPNTEVGDNYLAVCDGSADSSSDTLNVRSGILAVLQGRLPRFSLEYPCHSPQQQRWFNMVVLPMGRDGADSITITHTNITATKYAEQYEQFRSHILELLTGDQTLPRILETIVLGLEQLHPAMRCSILLLDREGKHLGQGVAPSLPEFYNTAIEGTEITVGAGSCGTAAATRERVIVDDITTHPYWTLYRELAVRADLGACWSQPICSAAGQVLGVFAIYHREARIPEKHDLALLEQTTHLTGIAIARKQTEEALRATHQQLESLTAAVPGVVYQFLVTPTGEWQFLYVSQGIQHLYGITPEAALQNHLAISDCILPERRAAYRESVASATVDLRFWEHEHQIMTPMGQLKWVRAQALPQRQADGSILWNGVLVDITERKKMEVMLQESNDMFSLFMHYSPILIYIKEVFPNESRVLKVSDNYQDLIGIPISEMVGKTMDELLPAEFAAKITAEDWAVVYGGQSMTINEDYNGRHYITTKFPIYHAGKNLLAGYTIDITERQQMEEQIRELAFYDALTQLPNRRLFIDRLNQTMTASKRSGCYGAVMFIDLDNFKPLNDTQGHKVGDLLLIEVAGRLKGCVREMDTVARFGGDEFVLILSELNVDKAKATALAEVVAEKIQLTLSEPYRLTLQHNEQAATTIEHHCTASIGVTVFINHEDSQPDVLKWADKAMYEAKKAGRNLIRFYGVSS